MVRVKGFLAKDHKIKLVEVLLVISTLLAAFEIPASSLWVFFIFLVLSIIYIVLLSAGVRSGAAMHVLSAGIAAGFSGTLVIGFGIRLIAASPFPVFAAALMIVYYLVLTAFLWAALYRRSLLE